MTEAADARPPTPAAPPDAIDRLVRGMAEAAWIRRLRAQAEAWEAETEALLDEIGVTEGWSCVDLGCGPRGILPVLVRRVGAAGRVVGVDREPALLDAARPTRPAGALLVRGDARATGLRAGAFDLVHARFLLQATGTDALIREMTALARPGGVVALQEPADVAWTIRPSPPGLERTAARVARAFRRHQHPFGRELPDLLRRAGLHDVRVRRVRLTLAGGHPYARTPLFALHAAGDALVRDRAMSDEAFAAAVRELERRAADPATVHRSFTVAQVWGRRL